jgi:quinol-cytochrome oxidoreductase complex cytochrome b subunit/mono/diheme cytochrome c family protein
MQPKDPVKADSTQAKSLPTRIYSWFNKRTGLGSIMQASLDEPIPGGARLAYIFGSGLLFIFISQVITGIALALYYVPSAETAHTSVAYITKQVAAGAFLRSLHYYGSSAMIIVLALHFLQTFLWGSFKGRRELLWISGALLSFLVLAMGFTGYLLPWDQKAYFATAVGTNIVGEIPLIGEWLTRLLRGGDALGTLTLSRFYVAHLFLIPAAIFLFIGVHIALFRKAGPAGPIEEDPVHPKLPAEGFYPRQVIMDMAFALLLMIGLGILAYFHPVELGPVANPADTQFLPRPEWYYLSMFEWLKFWQGKTVVFAIVVVPGILALLFFLLPFLDRSLERRPWRRPIPVLAVAIVLVGAIFLGIKSRLDDARDPTSAAQIALQDQQEKAYSEAPFEPYVETPGGAGPVEVATGPVEPSIALGKGIFGANGCAGCHGDAGTGTPAGPSLVGVTSKYPSDLLPGLLRDPNAKMRAGAMPAVDLSTTDMSALVSYLGALGTSAANVPATHTAQPHTAPPPLRAVKPGVSPTTATVAVSIAAGQEIFETHACSACHGAAGAGTARAPALAALVASLPDTQLAGLLRNPNGKMRAGGMSPLVATPEQEKSVIAYLRSLSPASPAIAQQQAEPLAPTAPEIASAPAPAPPPSNAATTATSVAAPSVAPVAVNTAGGRAVFVANGCAACHGPSADGTHFAPSLIGVGRRFPESQLTNLLRHPAKRMRDGGMPPVNVDDAHLQLLVLYLSGLSSNPQGSATTASQGVHPAAGSSFANPASGVAATSSAIAQAPRPPLSPEALRGRDIFQHNRCETCHGVGGLQGTVAAPGLAETASILPAATLEDLLRHHSKRMQQGGMPLTNMNGKDMNAIVAYIRSLSPPARAQ